MEASVLERLTLETGDIEHDDEHSFSRLNIREEEDIVDAIKTRVETGNKADVQAFGISCLQLFIDVNWTGRTVGEDNLSWINSEQISTLEDHLVESSDGLVDVAQLKYLLALARLILVDGRQHFQGPYSDVWCIRCALTVQTILWEKSSTLYNLLKDTFKELENQVVPAALKPIILLHESRFNYMFHDIRDSNRCAEAAAACLGLTMEDTGALGRRTKFQSTDLPQYTLNLQVAEDYARQPNPANIASLPTDLKLDDELRLERIQFKDRECDHSLDLDSLQQCVVLTRFFLKQRMLPDDELTVEEVMPHLTVILENPTCWANHMTALFNRCKLEGKSGRTIERARAQLEILLEAYNPEAFQPSRVRHCFLSGLPPKWEIQKELGSALLALGSTKAALDCYLALESWDEVIVCYNILQLRHKAAEIIKARLEVKETARLWCQLGDATDDVKCYAKALEISNNKSARAHKSLGLHHYFNRDYAASIEHFNRSLDCSRFQLGVLLRLGYAAMEIEKWEVGAQAYRSYCGLESDNFEAWNNLAKCYIKLGQKERAWRVLQEAVRCDFDNWKVWDNLMVISTDLGAFDETLRAYNRIIEIKKTHEDEQILTIVTKAVIEGTPNSKGDDSSVYRGSLQKLLARLSVCQPRDAIVWTLYGALLVSNKTKPNEDQVKGCHCLQKGIAAYTGKKGWEKELAICKKVLSVSRDLISAILSVEGPQLLQLANSARLTLSSSVKMVERSQTNVATDVVVPEVVEDLESTNAALQLLLDNISSLKQSG